MKSRNTILAALISLIAPSIAFAQATGKVVLDDTFTSGVDSTTWLQVKQGGRLAGRTPQDQYYTPTANVTDSNGLHITLTREDTVDPKTSHKYEYTAGRIESKATYLYGVFSFTARLPRGKGYWPALWLRTPERDPFNGEIDTLEGFGSRPNCIMSTVHHCENGKHLGSKCAVIDLGRTCPCNAVDVDFPAGHDFTTDYHTFSTEWRADHITWFLDGKPYFTATEDIPHIPMRIILECHVGGTFDGPPTVDTPAKATLDISKVQVLL